MVIVDHSVKEVENAPGAISWQLDINLLQDVNSPGAGLASESVTPNRSVYSSAIEAVQDYSVDQQIKILGEELSSGSGADKYQLRRVEPIRLPSLVFDQESRSWASGDMRRVALGIEGIVRNLALSTQVSGIRLTARVRRFREEGRPELKFTVYTLLNPEQAMAFWDAIEARVEQWRNRMPVRVRTILDESAAISVEWVE